MKEKSKKMALTWRRFKDKLKAASVHHQEDALLAHAFVNLESRLRTLVERQSGLSQDDQLLADIEQRLKGERSWATAQLIEQLMVPLLSDEEVTVELRRLSPHAARKEKLEELAQRLVEDDGQFELKRAVIDRLLKEQHRDYERKRLKRFYRMRIRRRISVFFILSFIAFFAPDQFLALQGLLNFSVDPKTEFVYLAVTAGLLGACVSMLSDLTRRLGTELDGLRAQSALSYLSFRVATGAAGGLVVFYFLHAQLLTGPLLPDLSDIIHVEGRHKSLLIVLCIAAGFSEKVVAGVLQRVQPGGAGSTVATQVPSATGASTQAARP